MKNKDTAISVKNISKTFCIPHKKVTSLRGAFVRGVSPLWKRGARGDFSLNKKIFSNFPKDNNYDTIILFSGDGDLMHAVRYLQECYQKDCIVFGARNHVGREVYDAKKDGIVSEILYAEDFEYRLSRDRF